MKKIILLLGIISLSSGWICSDTIPSDGRVDRERFILSLIKPGDIGAEIGVSYGVFAYHVLVPAQPSKLYLIDPWEYGLQTDVETDPTPAKQDFRDREYEGVCKAFAPYPNVEIVRMKSEDAAMLFPDNYFDYVYINGEHSYNAVMRDLTNYFPKVKVGGYILGDDYGWTGIADAVQDFLKAHRKETVWGQDPYLGTTGGQFEIRKIK
ncbi:MAG: class I SAM-dependent methyltransferase [Parachlamydiaceae bacterium]